MKLITPFHSLINSNRLTSTFVKAAETFAPSNIEKPMADLMVRRWEAMRALEPRMKIIVDDAWRKSRSNTGNVIIKIPRTPDAPKNAKKLGLFFHLDAVDVRAPGVPAGEPIRIKVNRTGKIHSLNYRTNIGADNRCGYAVVTEGVHAILENKIPHGDLVIVASTQEENTMAGARFLNPKHFKGLDFGFDFDGNALHDICTACAGLASWKIIVHGKASYITEPDGKNALDIARQALNLLLVENRSRWKKIGRIIENTYLRGGFLGKDGEPVTNVTPAEAIVAGECRARKPQELQFLLKHVKDAFAKVCQKHEVKFSWKTEEIPGFYLSENTPVVRYAKQAIYTVGGNPTLSNSMGGVSSSVFNQYLPIVALWDGSEKVHSFQEYTTIQNLISTTALVISLIAQSAKT